MAVSIHIITTEKRWKPAFEAADKRIQKAVQLAMAAAKAKGGGSINILLTNDKEMRRLNREFRGKDKATNVLSFAGEGKHLGDLALGFETVKREAKEQKKSFADHTTHLVVHGTLHLLGHDHDKEKAALKMESLEIQVLKKLGIKNPYVL